MDPWPDFVEYNKRVAFGCLIGGKQLGPISTLQLAACHDICEQDFKCEGFYYINVSMICFIISKSVCKLTASPGTAVYCRKSAKDLCSLISGDRSVPIWVIPSIIAMAFLLVAFCSFISSRTRREKRRRRRRSSRRRTRRKFRFTDTSRDNDDTLLAKGDKRRRKRQRRRREEEEESGAQQPSDINASSTGDASTIIAYHDLEKSTVMKREQNLAPQMRQALKQARRKPGDGMPADITAAKQPPPPPNEGRAPKETVAEDEDQSRGGVRRETLAEQIPEKISDEDVLEQLSDIDDNADKPLDSFEDIYSEEHVQDVGLTKFK